MRVVVLVVVVVVVVVVVCLCLCLCVSVCVCSRGWGTLQCTLLTGLCTRHRATAMMILRLVDHTVWTLSAR